MNKNAIRNFAIWARRKLISDITYKAGMLGITENGVAQPMKQSTKDLQFFDIGTKDYAEVSGAQIPQRNALLAAIRAKEKTADYKTAFRSVVDEVAYTWFNRLIAVRFMEVNDYLPSRVRVLSSEISNKLEPDFVTTPFETDLDFTPYEKDVVLQLKDQNKLDDLFRMLFIKQCNKLSSILPELFEQISDYTELLLTISSTDKDGVVWHLTHDISEDDFNVEKEGQVEIIGWLYQYYNTEPKNEVFDLLKKNVKITKERIPAATQLFTPDWIVRYMVENSLGRLWVEGHPNEDLKATWKYYLEEAEQEPEVQAQLRKIREEYAKITPEGIRLIDPCMGSGHALVYAFDMLMQIYTSCGYAQRDAAKSILQNNLFGIDIDTRAYQLAYFAVMMKARQYHRRIFSEGILPNLMAVRNPAPCSDHCLKQLGDLEKLGKRLIADFADAEEYGSILQLNYTREELDALTVRLDRITATAEQGDLLTRMEAEECVNTLTPLVRQARIMSQKYDVVVTNPPYMGASSMSEKLSGFVKKFYPDSKADMFAIFIERCGQMTRKNGFQAMITQHAWMFLSSFEKLRAKLQSVDTINMAHLGARAFEEIGGEVVQTTSFVLRNSHIPHYQGTYNRLIEPTTQLGKEEMFLAGKNQYIAQQDNFFKIPGAPIAYWVSEEGYRAFDFQILYDVAKPRQGMATTNNDLFLRLWFEVEHCKTGFGIHDPIEALASKKKWFPINKGGSYRRWYGNFDYIVNYENDGKTICDFIDNTPGVHVKSNGRVINRDLYFHHGMTWSTLSTGPFCMRFVPDGWIFETKGSMCFCEDNILFYLLSLYNSPVIQYYLAVISPTLDYHEGPIGRTPIILRENSIRKIEPISKACVALSRTDWDSFEISWDFQRHPLIRLISNDPEERTVANSQGKVHHQCPLENAFTDWAIECEERFLKLQANEEEMNRIFIDIYGLQDELTPDVDDKDVTVRRADLGRDIRSLISYAVGCMFGRYSLDVPGLAYAGGTWDESKYRAFIPDSDNCIPITDEEYFPDDIVGRFVEFIRVVYGDATLEQNLEFIAKALGNGGKTSRNTIRRYFLNDFYKDHLKIYQKRPIYWLFDSGKQNGFKALVYMHRWNADTVGNLRVEYLHKIQTVYEKEIENCQDAIDNSLNNREIAAATKRKEKLIKQLKECKDYDAKVAHIALSRIDIDLDDGVKFNYRKAQTGADGRFCEILADSKDIMIKEDSPIWQTGKSHRTGDK